MGKFALLVATAAAITIKEQGCVIPKDDIQEGFDYVDTNHNGSIDAKELETALKALANHFDVSPTKKQIGWVVSTATKDAGADHVMDVAEFGKFANAFVNHFDMCDMMH